MSSLSLSSQMKWHEISLSTPAAILEVLNAWENGVLSVEAVQVRRSMASSCFLTRHSISKSNNAFIHESYDNFKRS